MSRWQDFRRRQWDAAGRDINPEHLSPRFAAFVLDAVAQGVAAGALAPQNSALIQQLFRGAERGTAGVRRPVR